MRSTKYPLFGSFMRRTGAFLLAAGMLFGTFVLTGCAGSEPGSENNRSGARNVGQNENGEPVAVSPALQILADENRAMAVSALAGQEIYLSRDRFARAMNLPTDRIDSVTVLTLPDALDGQILLGAAVLTAGQRIPGDKLDFLRYLPHSTDPGKGRFTFMLNDSATVYTCDLYHLSRVNRAPEVSHATSASLHVSTYRDVSSWGRLVASDPDGDLLTFEIVDRPLHGQIVLTDPARGTYVYSPAEGYAGVDRFRYVAHDAYGNYSACATVSLRIEKPGTDVVYTDLRGSEAENAALRLTAAGIMSGRMVGGSSHFDPDGAVSRADFLVMAMRTLGIDTLPGTPDTTGFFDDASIDAGQKPYVAAAVSLGFVNGCVTDGHLCFEPDRAITRAEAAVMLTAMLGTSVPTFTDSIVEDLSTVPVWARASVCTLTLLGIMPAGETPDAASPLTRADAARMLASLL